MPHNLRGANFTQALRQSKIVYAWWGGVTAYAKDHVRRKFSSVACFVHMASGHLIKYNREHNTSIPHTLPSTAVVLRSCVQFFQQREDDDEEGENRQQGDTQDGPEDTSSDTDDETGRDVGPHLTVALGITPSPSFVPGRSQEQAATSPREPDEGGRSPRAGTGRRASEGVIPAVVGGTVGDIGGEGEDLASEDDGHYGLGTAAAVVDGDGRDAEIVCIDDKHVRLKL